MSGESVPSTKKLKSMLRMLNEFGVSKYRDSEVEIEFSGIIPISAEQVEASKKDFSMDNYAQQQTAQASQEPVDSLGLSEHDYLTWSSGAG